MVFFEGKTDIKQGRNGTTTFSEKRLKGLRKANLQTPRTEHLFIQVTYIYIYIYLLLSISFFLVKFFCFLVKKKKKEEEKRDAKLFP